MKQRILVLLLLIPLSGCLIADDNCSRVLEDMGISATTDKSSDGTLMLNLHVSLTGKNRLKPLFIYLKYSDEHGVFLKIPVFLKGHIYSDDLNYKIATNEKSLKNLIIETFFYPPHGGEGIYFYISGFSNISELKCDKSNI